jgi:hypothetical protein
MHGCGLERPTLMIQCCGPGQYSRVRRPSLGWTELRAAVGSLFTRGWRCRGQCRPQLLEKRRVTCKVETAIIKANSSWFSIAAAGALPHPSTKVSRHTPSHTLKMSYVLSLSHSTQLSNRALSVQIPCSLIIQSKWFKKASAVNGTPTVKVNRPARKTSVQFISQSSACLKWPITGMYEITNQGLLNIKQCWWQWILRRNGN